MRGVSRAWRRARRSAFTLFELLISMAIMTILVGGMTSAVLVAAHALPDEDDLSLKTAQAVDAATTVAADLATATRIVSAGPNTIEFLVPDRGHGATGPETIRYAWSGTPGDPLTRTYNGAAPVTVTQKVYAFTLNYTTTFGANRAPPRVLLVDEDPTSPKQRSLDMLSTLASWGWPTVSIGDKATPAEYATALQSVDVVYTMPQVRQGEFDDKPMDITLGVVIADTDLYDEFGVAANKNTNNRDSVTITVIPHEVTKGFAVGALRITSTVQSFSEASLPAMGASWLALGSNIFSPALLSVDRGARLTTGVAAAGRRIVVPTGTTQFEYSRLTRDGQRLERNAILWAAAPTVITYVKLTVQVGPDSAGQVISGVQLLNRPEAPR